MSQDDRRRRGGFVPIGRLAPPSGGPPRLYERARFSRVRELLGPTIGPQLLELRDRGDRVELVLAGRGWEQALAAELERLAAGVARRLGRASVELVVRSRPDAESPTARSRPGARETHPGEIPGPDEARERLARLGARFEERRQEESDER